MASPRPRKYQTYHRLCLGSMSQVSIVEFLHLRHRFEYLLHLPLFALYVASVSPPISTDGWVAHRLLDILQLDAKLDPCFHKIGSNREIIHILIQGGWVVLGLFDHGAFSLCSGPCTRKTPNPCTTVSFCLRSQLFTRSLPAKWYVSKRNYSPLKRWQPKASAAGRSQRRLECACRRRSGACRGSARETTWCHATLGDHVVRRVVCVWC